MQRKTGLFFSLKHKRVKAGRMIQTGVCFLLGVILVVSPLSCCGTQEVKAADMQTVVNAADTSEPVHVEFPVGTPDGSLPAGLGQYNV